MNSPKQRKPKPGVDPDYEAAVMQEEERRRLLMARGRRSTIHTGGMGDTSSPVLGIARAYAAQG